MRTYIVAKIYKSIDTTPSVVGHFNTRVEADLFAALCKKTDSDYDFAVYELRGVAR